jgi:hypothetical protein
MERQAFTIDEFCQSHGFNRAHYFNLLKAGLGPHTMKVGARRLISQESAAEWRREREAA